MSTFGVSDSTHTLGSDLPDPAADQAAGKMHQDASPVTASQSPLRQAAAQGDETRPVNNGTLPAVHINEHTHPVEHRDPPAGSKLSSQMQQAWTRVDASIPVVDNDTSRGVDHIIHDAVKGAMNAVVHEAKEHPVRFAAEVVAAPVIVAGAAYAGTLTAAGATLAGAGEAAATLIGTGTDLAVAGRIGIIAANRATDGVTKIQQGAVQSQADIDTVMHSSQHTTEEVVAADARIAQNIGPGVLDTTSSLVLATVGGKVVGAGRGAFEKTTVNDASTVSTGDRISTVPHLGITEDVGAPSIGKEAGSVQLWRVSEYKTPKGQEEHDFPLPDSTNLDKTDLYREAIKSNREPIDLGKIWPQESKVLLVGENHGVPQAHEELLGMLPKFKELGLTHYASEFWGPKEQPLVDAYVHGEIPKSDFVAAMGRSRYSDGHFPEEDMKLIDASIQNGVKPIGLDLSNETINIKLKELEQHPDYNHTHPDYWAARDKIILDEREKQWQGIISDIVKTDSQARVLVHAGAEHVEFDPLRDSLHIQLAGDNISTSSFSFKGGLKSLSGNEFNWATEDLGLQQDAFAVRLRDTSFYTGEADWIVHIPVSN